MKAIEFKTFILFNFGFAKLLFYYITIFYNILQYYFIIFSFFFLIFDLCLLIPAAIAQSFNSIAELVIPIGIPIKEAKSKIELHPVIK